MIQHVLKMQYIALLPTYTKLISEGVFHVFTYVNVGL